MKNAIKIILTYTMIVMLSNFISSAKITSAQVLVSNEPSFTITFSGLEETVLSPRQWGLEGTPDGGVSFLRTNNTINMWFTANSETAYLIGSTFEQLAPYKLINDTAETVLKPSGTGFDKNYAGPGTVIRAANGTDLLMFYHAEDHTCGGDKARISIGLARSSDGGITWTRQGQIITGRDVSLLCPKFNGAGYPSVVLSPDNQYLYLYFVDWDSDYQHGPDEVHIARALRSSDGMPGTWLKYKNGNFSQPGLAGDSDPVIHRTNIDAGYAGNPSVSFNINLNRYLAIITSRDGFYYTSSINGIEWDTPKIFWAFSNPVNAGDPWYSYASLLSVDQNSQSTTNQTGYLYYAHGLWQQYHTMTRRAVKIGFNVFLPVVINNQQTILRSCQTFTTGEVRTVGSESFVVGDIEIDGIKQYDLKEKEGTIAFFNRNSSVLAPWGAACYQGGQQFLNQIMQNEFAHGCGNGCSKVRFVTVSLNSQQNAQCYYPDGTVKELQNNTNETWCP